MLCPDLQFPLRWHVIKTHSTSPEADHRLKYSISNTLILRAVKPRPSGRGYKAPLTGQVKVEPFVSCMAIQYNRGHVDT